MTDKTNVKTWLAENGHADVLALIEAQEQRWAAEGKKTRRNWWDVLAGGKNGRAKVIGGIEYPVLAAAQQRAHRTVTENALGGAPAPAPAPRIVEAAVEAEVEPEPVLEALPEIVAQPVAEIAPEIATPQ